MPRDWANGDEWRDPEKITDLDPAQWLAAYHAYDDDYAFGPVLQYHFVLDPRANGNESIDIRFFPGYDPGLSLAENIRAAFQAGQICVDETGRARALWVGEVQKMDFETQLGRLLRVSRSGPAGAVSNG